MRKAVEPRAESRYTAGTVSSTIAGYWLIIAKRKNKPGSIAMGPVASPAIHASRGCSMCRIVNNIQWVSYSMKSQSQIHRKWPS